MTNQHTNEMREAFEADCRKRGWDYLEWHCGGNSYTNRDTQIRYEGWQAATKSVEVKYKKMPANPNVGDGLLWDGNAWINVAPSMEAIAMLNMRKEYLPVIEKLVASFNAAKEEIRWYKQKSGGDVESGRIIGAENILAEFRDVTRMAETLAAPLLKGEV